MLYTTLRNLLLLGALALATLAPTLYPTDISGTWQFELVNEAASESITVSIQQQDSVLFGNYYGFYTPAKLNGKIEGKTIAFTYAIDGVPVNHFGQLNGASISGIYHAGQFEQGSFHGRRIR